MGIEEMEMEIEHIQRYANHHNITFDEAKARIEDDKENEEDGELNRLVEPVYIKERR